MPTTTTVSSNYSGKEAGAIVLDERVVAPGKFKNDFDVCKEDFRSTWSSDLIGDSAMNPNMASDIQAAILGEVLAAHAEKLDSDIWNGDNTDTSQFDGFVKQFTADASVIKPNNAGTAIDVSNVLTEMAKVRAAIPVALRRKDLVFAVSPDVADFYAQALIENRITNGINAGVNTNDGAAMVYGRYGLTIVNGLPDDTMVVYEAKNLVFGTGLLGDHNQVAIVDEDEVGLLTGQVRGKLVYNAGVNYYNSEDIVYY